MRYMLLIYHGPDGAENPEALPDEEKHALYSAWQSVREAPGVTPGLGLEPPDTATTIRVENGETLVTDGPYAEAKEAIGGYFVLEADDLDAAIELASRVPPASRGGAIEVRPIAQW